MNVFVLGPLFLLIVDVLLSTAAVTCSQGVHLRRGQSHVRHVRMQATNYHRAYHEVHALKMLDEINIVAQ